MKYLFYLLPGLLNVILGLLFFITAKRMADAGLSSLAVTAAMPMWALVYAVTSFFIGKAVTRYNAVKILFISQFILLASTLGLLLTPSVKMQYLWLVGTGMGTGLFFTPFQAVVKLFEKVEISPETFSRSAAIYTFSWSFGQGTGPLLAAVIWGALDPVNGWKYCHVINIAIVITVLITLIFMNRFIRKRLADCDNDSESDTPSAPDNIEYLPDIMKPVWILACGGYLAIAALRSYMPDYATKYLNLATSSQGIMLSLISLVQAFVALAFWKAKRIPFKPYLGLLSGICAVTSLLMIAICSSDTAVWMAAILIGVFSGVFCFNLTYHALANFTCSARYAAVNETIVGSTSVFAPLATGIIAQTCSVQMPFYILMLIQIIAVTVFCKQTWKYRNF